MRMLQTKALLGGGLVMVFQALISQSALHARKPEGKQELSHKT